MRFRRAPLLLLFAAVALAFFYRCTSGGEEQTPADKGASFNSFAGSDACLSCHKNIAEQHRSTAHHLTSLPAAQKNIMGSFENGKNAFAYNALNKVKMEQGDSSFYQTYYRNDVKDVSEKIDIVVGSGRKGQSYLSWAGNHLTQLPITYFTPAGQWSNSPGYPPSKVVFNRPVTSRCLECHSTYFEASSVAGSKREAFDRNRIIYGVDCEKCHGPAAAHVAFQTQNPQSKDAKFIINPGKLSRDRLLDFCALCHGGPLAKTKPSFSFAVGDTLSNHFSVAPAPPMANGIDVHGNQLGLLEQSKCFQLSAITCLSCHNVHENEKDELAVFSNRCLSCHDNSHQKECKMKATLGNVITQNCIDCHMPKQPSHAVAVYLQGASSPTPALLRTHYIATYPEETKKYIQSLQQQKAKGRAR